MSRLQTLQVNTHSENPASPGNTKCLIFREKDTPVVHKLSVQIKRGFREER